MEYYPEAFHCMVDGKREWPIIYYVSEISCNVE